MEYVKILSKADRECCIRKLEALCGAAGDRSLLIDPNEILTCSNYPLESIIPLTPATPNHRLSYLNPARFWLNGYC